MSYNPTSKDLPPKRFEGITRPYSAAHVEKLRGSAKIEYTLAKLIALRPL